MLNGFSISFKHIKIICSILIIIALLIFIKDFDFSSISIEISLFDISAILFVLTASLLLRAWRWQLLMNNLQEKKLSFLFSTKLLFIGQALNIIMPAGAGDVAKSYFGYKQMGMKERMFSVSLFDKVIAIASIGLLACYSIYMSGEILYVLLIGISITPLLLILFADSLTRIPRIQNLIQFIQTKTQKINLNEIIHQFKFSGTIVSQSLLISVIAWIFTYTLLYFCFVLFGIAISFETVIIFSPILTLARLFPLTLNGIGSDEALMVYLFSMHGDNNQSAILLGALLYRMILIMIPALPGIFFTIYSSQSHNYNKE
ncbi:MAG: lysylphosphatidylglycerol synthase transmembrane domain-containing protein [bacterium]